MKGNKDRQECVVIIAVSEQYRVEIEKQIQGMGITDYVCSSDYGSWYDAGCNVYRCEKTIQTIGCDYELHNIATWDKEETISFLV